jgi:O-antigen/teichoic acid export membrane protein
MTLDIISIVAGSRLAAGIFRFYSKAETADARYGVLSTALILMTSSYTLVALLAWAISIPASQLMFQTPEYAGVIRIAACSFAFQGLLEVPLVYLRAREKPWTFVTVSSGKLLMQAALNLLFLAYFDLGIRSVFLSSLISNVVIGLILAVQLVGETGLRFSRRAARDLVRFGLPLVLTQVATFISTYGDRYFLRAHGDTTVVGLYALAYNFGFLLYQLGHSPFALVWDPVRYEIAKRDDRDVLYARAFVYLNVLLLTVAVLIALYVGDFLRLVAQPAFYPAADIVPVILVAYVFQAWTGVQDIGIMIRERTEYNTLANWVGALVALAGYAWLIPRYLGLGAALATVASFVVRYGMIYFLSQRLWPVRYRWGPVIRLIAVASAVIVASGVLPRMALGPSVGARTMLLLVYLVGVWHLNVIPRDDRSLIGSLVSPRAIRAHLSGLVGGAAGGKS